MPFATACRKLNENKLITKKKKWVPVNSKCKLCKSNLHQEAKYCQPCAYQKGESCACCTLLVNHLRHKARLLILVSVLFA